MIAKPLVARMEPKRNPGIGHDSPHCTPDSTALHPGYKLVFPFEHQTLVSHYCERL